MKVWIEKNITTFLLSGFVLMTIFVIPRFELPYQGMILMTLCYMLLYVGVVLLPKNKITSLVKRIVHLSPYLLHLIKPISGVFLLIGVTVILPFSIFFWISYMALFLLELPFNMSILWYLSFISTSIVLVEFSKQILNVVFEVVPKNIKRTLKSDFDLSKLLVDNKKIRAMIYFLYLPFIISFSIIKISDLTADSAMLQASFYAFATFIAYDRIRQQNDKEVKIKWRDLFDKTLDSAFYSEKKKENI